MAVRALLLAVVVGLTGCAKAAPPDPCAGADGGAPVGTALLAFLSRSRAAHHRADAREEQNDLRAAETELTGIIDGPKPACPDAPEVREVLADTRARLADLESRHGEFDAALRALDQGLALVPETSYFRGHLFEVRGLVEERRAKALAALGDKAAAGAAGERALAAFQEAMRLQTAVIEAAAPKR
jgi:tetratricopeptide (TPR) repeat protein